jgi:hypothetical protein
MLLAMGLLRIMLTGLLALALMLGPGWLPCIAFHQQHRVAASLPMDHMASNHMVSDHMASHQGDAYHQHMMANDDVASDKDHAVMAGDNKGRATSNEPACPECCGVCTLTSAMPPGTYWTVAPMVSRIFFASLSEQLRGHIIFVDPDIPKHVG